MGWDEVDKLHANKRGLWKLVVSELGRGVAKSG